MTTICGNYLNFIFLNRFKTFETKADDLFGNDEDSKEKTFKSFKSTGTELFDESPSKFKTFESNFKDLFADEAASNSNEAANFVVDDTMATDKKDPSLESIDNFLESLNDITHESSELNGSKEEVSEIKIQVTKPILKAFNPTSTPMRSILKKPGQSSLRKTLLIQPETLQSQIGITQALNILQTDSPSIQFTTSPQFSTKLDKLPYNFYFKEADIVSFDLKSTIYELFDSEDNDIIMTSVVKKSLICLDSTGEQMIHTSGIKKRKLRFDESSIFETSLGSIKKPKIERKKGGNFNNLNDVVISDDELQNFLIQVS